DNMNGYVYPAWSPDSKKLAYAEPTDAGLEIFMIDPDGSNKKQLSKLGGLNTYAAWSPDGKQIVFHHSGGNEDGIIYLMEADGSNPKEILKGEGPDQGGRAAWKPK